MPDRYSVIVVGGGHNGLYLCGAGTHPGVEVTGAPGNNAAQAVLRDFELAK